MQEQSRHICGFSCLISNTSFQIIFAWNQVIVRLFLDCAVVYMCIYKPSIKCFGDQINIFLSLPNNVWRLIVFALFLLIIIILLLFLSFFLWTMNLSMADLRNCWTEFHETWWSYRYMCGPKVFNLVVKRVKVIFWGVQRGWGLL